MVDILSSQLEMTVSVYITISQRDDGTAAAESDFLVQVLARVLVLKLMALLQTPILQALRTKDLIQ